LCDPAYLFAVLDIFRSRFGNVSFFMENGIDYMLLDPALVQRLARLGMAQLNISLGSATADAALKEHRPLDLRRYETVVRAAACEHIPCITYFICGLEADTRRSTAQTLAYLTAQPTRVGISLFYAVPGVAGFGDYDRFDRLPSVLAAGSSAYPWTGALDTRALVTAFRLARFVNACRETAPDSRLRELIERIWRERRLLTLARTRRGVETVAVPHADTELAGEFFAAVERGASPGRSVGERKGHFT
jgi:hypothetical protein